MIKINLYILDRNAVSIIVRHEKKKIIRNIKEYIQIMQLKDIDRPYNIISVFASTKEGINPYKKKITNREKQLSDEISAVKNFFEFANTDVEIISPIANILASEDFFYSFKFKIGMKFLCEISPYLYNKISDKNFSQFDKIQEKIFDTAKQLGLSSSHPVVVCTISALYGNKETLHMLKLHKKKYSESLSYNAMSDVAYIKFISIAREGTNKMFKIIYSYYGNVIDGHVINVLPFSFDNDLLYVYNIFQKYNFLAHNDSHNIVNSSLIYLPKCFFPYAKEDQYNSIIKKIYSN